MRKKTIKLMAIVVLAFLMLAGALAAKAVVSSGGAPTTQNKFQQAKQTFLDEFNATRSTKRAFEEAQTKFKNLKTSATSTAATIRAQFQQKAGAFLKKEMAAMIKYLEVLKNKVNNMQKMDDGDRAGILAKIDANITWLQGKQAEIDGASADKLKTISQEVKDYWKNIRVTSRRVTGQILASRINYLIGKAEAMAAKLEVKIQELKQAGKDTAKLEELLADFKTKIASAKDSLAQARAKFAAISSKDDVVQFYQEGHKFIKDANQYLKQAKNDLVQIVRRIKQMEQPNSGNATSSPQVHSGNEPG
jgi:chromosome segregation ATPase